MLDEIQKPSDLKNYDLNDLKRLAQEIRRFLVQSVSKTGGHLASNLGVVELTLILCKLFDFPKDSIVWDVGHQSYVYKMLTGRMDGFKNLRELDSMSGFPSIKESPYDVFGTGHASTSIAAANGIATAKRLRGDDSMTVAVIGDGALTGGLALESINNLVDSKNRLIIVLNDNEMSIDENIGATNFMLSRLRVAQPYLLLKDNLSEGLERLPNGERVMRRLKRAKDSVKQLVVPGMSMENLGLKYYGPIDGHDLNELYQVFKRIGRVNRPVMIHIKTVKGMGYRPAIQNPAVFHGVSPFRIQTGEMAKGKKTYTDVFGEELLQLAGKHRDIVAVTAAMMSSTGLKPMKEAFPDRVFDVGIAESYAVTYAGGLAAAGMRPVVAIYSTFLQRAYDQLLHDICLQKLPVIFAVDRAGIVGKDGATHQGLFDMSFLRAMPNMTVLAPADEDELRDALRFAYEMKDGPVVVRYPRGTAEKSEAGTCSPWVTGRSETVRTGKGIAVIAVGSEVAESLRAAERLEGEFGPITVVNARFVKPADREMICKLSETHDLLVTVEEGILSGGFGSGVLEIVAEENLPVHVKTIGVKDCFVHHGDPKALRRRLHLDADGLAETIREAAAAAGIKPGE